MNTFEDLWALRPTGIYAWITLVILSAAFIIAAMSIAHVYSTASDTVAKVQAAGEANQRAQEEAWGVLTNG